MIHAPSLRLDDVSFYCEAWSEILLAKSRGFDKIIGVIRRPKPLNLRSSTVVAPNCMEEKRRSGIEGSLRCSRVWQRTKIWIDFSVTQSKMARGRDNISFLLRENSVLGTVVSFNCFSVLRTNCPTIFFHHLLLSILFISGVQFYHVRLFVFGRPSTRRACWHLFIGLMG